MSAFVGGHGLTLGQIKTQEKSNEITAIPQLIDALALKDSIVTLDTMGCQKAIVAAIAGKQADYVFALKASHDKLCRQVNRLSDTAEWLHYADVPITGQGVQGKGHGCCESRRCLALPVPEIESTDSWFGLQRVVMVESMPDRHQLHKRKAVLYQFARARQRPVGPRYSSPLGDRKPAALVS